MFGWLAQAPDGILASFLRSRRRMGQEEVDRAVAARDAQEGEFVSHELSIHHWGESAH